MKKYSIPAFVENLVPDTANAKYSRAKLKMYYVGETVDGRLFTKEFSDILLSTAAYTPVVGWYSVGKDDFVGHNGTQNIYGIIPGDAELTYELDNESGVTYAVTDVILYTGRPDETGLIAAKIVGKQHSLELNPDTVQYKINEHEDGSFKNIEFLSGELVGLSVLGDDETPAFTGSSFFCAEELPDFVTEENKTKYEALFSAMIGDVVTTKGSDENVQETQDEPVIGDETTASADTSTSLDSGETIIVAEENVPTEENEELQALRSNCADLEATITELNHKLETLEGDFRAMVVQAYEALLGNIDEYVAEECSALELATKLHNVHLSSTTTNTDIEIIEMSFIDTTTQYSELDEAAVVQKYINMNRGKN